MTSWQRVERADDERLARSLLAGDASATALAYDLYAARLFDYCHVLVRDRESAALAVLDSLLTVRERVGELSDIRMFRGWLYTVTRDECLRRRVRSEVPAERRRAAEAPGLAVDEETRRLVHTALLALSGRQREALDLHLRHGLDQGEVAGVLGMSPQDASALLVRARRDFDDAVAAVTVAGSGRDACPSVAALAGPPGRRLDAETCGALARHITQCPICGARDDREIPAERLLAAMPVAAVPGDLRQRVLAAAAAPRRPDPRPPTMMEAGFAGEAPDEAGPRSRTSHRRGPEGESRTTSRLLPAVAAVAFGLVAIGGTVFVLSSSGSQNTGDNQAIAPSPGGMPSDDPSTPDSAGPVPGGRSGAASPSPSSSSSTPTPTPTASTSDPSHKSSSPAGPPSSPVSAPAQPPPQQPPPPGTLAAYGCTMHGSRSCTITLVASGGPVSWSVAGVHGNIRASGGGYLTAGQSTGVRVTRDADFCVGSGSGSVSFSPSGNAQVSFYC